MDCLNDYKRNIYSQFGEDGILEKIIEIINPDNKVCLEVGAWDGLKYSNTARLYKNLKWEAILIESDPERFKELHENTKGLKTCLINKQISRDGDSIDSLIQSKPEPSIMSIDIDGNDYYVFQALKTRPEVIIIEYNPTIPPHIELIPPENNNIGCSALALHRLAIRKQYYLVAMTDSNMFFVRNDKFELFKDYKTYLLDLFPFYNLVYLITDYSGNYAFDKKPLYGFRDKLNNEITKENKLWIK